MSTGTFEQRSGSALAGHPWRLWASQIWAVLGLEMRKRLSDIRAVWVYLLAFLPVGLMTAVMIIAMREADDATLGEVAEIYALLFESLILRGIVFLGCVGIFTALFRGEVLQGSLHYYFLAPIRRQVLVVGKYVAGLAVAVPLFGLSAMLTMAITYVPYASPGQEREILPALLLSHGAAYLGMVVLACLGYGAVFMFSGLYFRNPIIPAAVIFGWESINFLLPPVLKKLSVVHYLRALRPVEVSEGPFALLADPTPVWVAVPSVLAVAALFVVLAALSVRRIEIDYGGD